MSLPLFQVDSFTKTPFSGNPAAVCLLTDDRSAAWMQSVASEMNLSETAFVRRLDDGFSLRWFTPSVEVDLCGHATLAAAFTLWHEGDWPEREPIRFHSRSGVLTCRKKEDLIELDFPATPAVPCDPPAGLLEALNLNPTFVGSSTFDKIIVVESASAVRSLQPDFAALRELLGVRGVIVTSRSDDPNFDFISRYFCPGIGIDEDPVTGSAHCTLAPYWSVQLNKQSLTGYQASRRGGVVRVELCGDRVRIRGHAVMVLRGELLDAE